MLFSFLSFSSISFMFVFTTSSERVFSILESWQTFVCFSGKISETRRARRFLEDCFFSGLFFSFLYILIGIGLGWLFYSIKLIG